jgi:hypothetical protein
MKSKESTVRSSKDNNAITYQFTGAYLNWLEKVQKGLVKRSPRPVFNPKGKI